MVTDVLIHKTTLGAHDVWGRDWRTTNGTFHGKMRFSRGKIVTCKDSVRAMLCTTSRRAGRLCQMTDMVVRDAEAFETEAIAGLRWRWIVDRGGVPVVSREDFVASMVAFAVANEDTHHRVVALRDGAIVGMGWLAVLPRVPSPRAVDRASGDVQCVYVVPEERNSQIGSAIMAAILDKARALNLEHVTVHSSSAAIHLYERAGFTVSPRALFADFTGR